jgi:hypothetical protein
VSAMNLFQAMLSPLFDTVSTLWSRPELTPQLSAKFEYLLVEFEGRQAFMALGRRDTDGTDVRQFWHLLSTENDNIIFRHYQSPHLLRYC